MSESKEADGEKSDVNLFTPRNYRIDGEGYTYNRRIHLLSVSLDSGKIEHITKGTFGVRGFDFSSH